ncbi:MAG: hypothetical protein HUU38_21095 [Anaerolineales bacterium]|jgi:hypothetical protein|nr:hypothetical protein [Anaerolineales bacterium]
MTTSQKPQLTNWLLAGLIIYGVAGFLSVIAAAASPTLAATLVQPFFCSPDEQARVEIVKDGKYTIQQLSCVTAEGQIVQSFTGSFRLVWATYWVIPVAILFFFARKRYLAQNKHPEHATT